MKASDFVQLMKQERESSPAPAIPSAPAAPAPVAGVPSAADFVKRLSVNRDHRIADSGTVWDSVKDKGASLVAGAPALGKTVYDILRLATGDADWTVYGSRKYDDWQKAAVDALMSDAGKAKRRILERPINDPDAGVPDVLKTALSNPDAAVNMAVESMPTMLATAFGGGTTAAAAKTGAKLLGKELSKQALSKAATAGTIGTSAAMNAGDTFTSDAVQDLPMANRYQGAALSAALSAVAGKLLDGGAEGILARNMAGQGSKKGLVRGVVGGGAKEGGQEFVEEGGNAGGEQLAAREFRPNDILKRGALGGTVGTIMGGPIGGLEGMASRGQASEGATTKGAPTSSTLDALKVGGDTAVASEQGERVVRPDAKITESSDNVVGEAKRIGEAQVLPGSDRVVRVQNRDRSTPASIAQMTSIAAKPDYGRLSPSRDFGNGTPVVAYGSVDDTHKGRTDYAVTADGERIPVQYAVVEADDVLASNDSSGNVVREYKTAGPDRMRVIAGNGRVAGMKRAYEQGTAAEYREEMTADAENFGVDPAVIGQMKSPVLVRIMPEDKIRTDVGSISNTATNMDMSVVEKANDDAANIDFGTLEFDEDGNPTDETVRQFVGKFPAGQAAGMMSGDGTISQQAKARFGAALFKKAYDNDQLTAIFAESTEGEAKNILKAMSAVAGKMVRLEGGGDFDLRPIVAEAAEIIVNARREGKTVSQYVSEGSLGQSAEAAVVAEALDANKRSVKEMTRILGEAADTAFEAMSPQQNLLEEKPTRETVFKKVKGEIDAKREAEKQQSEEPAGPADAKPVEDGRGASTVEEDVQRDASESRGQDDAEADGKREEVTEEVAEKAETVEKAEVVSEAREDDGVGEVKRSRRGDVSEPARKGARAEIDRALESDPDVGEAYRVLRDQGKVRVVDKVEDLPERVKSALGSSAKGSLSATKSVSVNIKRGLEAITKALLDKTTVHRAMFRAGLGWVDFVWGEVGGKIRSNDSRPGERGVSHILEARQRKDGLSYPEVTDLLGRIVETIAKGGEISRAEFKGHLRVKLIHNGVLVGLVKNPGSNAWVLTGFEIRDSGDNRVGKDFPASTSRAPHTPGAREGAESLSPRTKNERHALASDKSDGLGERLSMESNSSISRDGVVLKHSDDGSVQGVYDTRTGETYIVASNVTTNTAKGVFLHEVGVHMATDARADMKPLALRARNMINNGARNGDTTALAVKRRMVYAGLLSDVKEDIKPSDAEEAFAYLVEVASNADSRSPFRKWFDSVIARIKRWLNDHGIKLNIKPDEFVEIALGNAQAMAHVQGRRLNFGKEFKKSVIGKSIERHLGGDWGKAIQLDKTGRKKFAWGEHALVGGTNVALDVLEAAIPAMRTTYSIRYARPEVRRMIREYAAKCDAAVQEAGGVAQEMMKWSSADRELLSDTIEGMLQTGVLPPQHVVEAANKMSQLMTDQARELVELGMLSEQAAARWRGRYLPRFYKERDPLLGESWFKNLFKRGGTIRGVGGGSLKGRGCYKVVDSAAVPDFVRLGWEVRDARYNFNERQHKLVDPKDGKGIKSGVPVTIWRDWTPEERRQMGEIRDAGYRFAMGWMQTQRDIALGRLFKNIASNPELCSSVPMDGYSHVPDTEISETGGVKKYGALAGMYVRDDVLASIMPHAEVSSAFMRGYKKLLAYWKEGKTALNPVSHMNNCVGNVVMAHLAGVDMWNAKAYVDTILDIANHEKWIEDAQKAGLYSGLFTREEIEEMLPEEFQKLLASEKSATARGADWVFTYVLNYGLRGTMRKAYEFEDKLFRLVIYKSALDRGLTEEEAVDYTLSFIPTYDDLPGGARAIRDTAIPFFAWTYKTIPTILLCAARYPWRFAAIATVLHAANALSYAVSAGDDDDDWLTRWQKGRKLAEAEEKLLPDYMRGWGAFANPKFLRLWTDETTGMPVYWNISNFVPGGQMFDATNQAGGMPWPEMLNPSSPTYSVYCALFLNVDTFMGRPLTLDSDTGWEKTEKRASYMWRQLAPAMAAGGYHYERIMNAMANATGDSIMGYTGVGRNGQAVTPLSAAFNTIGIKVRDVDFEQEAQHRMAQIMAEMKEVKANIRRVARQLEKGSITQEAFDEYRDEQIGKINRSAEKLKEIREADETVRQNARQ